MSEEIKSINKEYASGNKIILASRYNSKRSKILLCLWGSQFVTWEADNNNVTYWGHYFTDLAAAYEDYKNR